MVLAGPVLGLALMVGAWWRDASDPTAVVLGAAVLTASTLGFAFDDPAASTLASSPSTLGWRRPRLATVPWLVLVALVWAAEVAVARRLAADAMLLDRASLELVAFATVALALAAYGSARIDPTAGGTVALLGWSCLAAVLFFASQAAPASWRLPQLLPDPHSERWWGWPPSGSPCAPGTPGIRRAVGRQSDGASDSIGSHDRHHSRNWLGNGAGRAASHRQRRRPRRRAAARLAGLAAREVPRPGPQDRPQEHRVDDLSRRPALRHRRRARRATRATAGSTKAGCSRTSATWRPSASTATT